MTEGSEHTISKINRGEGIPTRVLSVEESADVLFWSFFYSQGDKDGQQLIFAYCANKHPEWILSKNGHAVADNVTARLSKMVASGLHAADVGHPPLTILREYSHLQEVLKRRVIEYRDPKRNLEKIVRNVEEVSLSEIFNVMMTGDIDHVFGPIQRPGDRENVKSAHLQKQFGHFVGFVVAGEIARGPNVFKEMIDDLRKEYQRLILMSDPDRETANFIKHAQSLISDYNKKNPDKAVNLDGSRIVLDKLAR